MPVKFSDLLRAEKVLVDVASSLKVELLDADAAVVDAHQAVLDGLVKLGGKAAVVNPPNVDIYTLDDPPDKYCVASFPEDPEV